MKPSGRLDWVDVARGLGIILVVYAHALRAHFPPQAAVGWAVDQDRVIYAFHMPLFFLLAGLFLWPSVGRDRGRFLGSRWWQMVWPYLLWSAITAGLELALAPYVNSPLTWRNLAMIPLEPIEQYWFLYALLIHQLVVAALWPRKALLLPAALAGLALVAAFGGGWIHIRAFSYFPYLVAGVLLAASLQALAARSADGSSTGGSPLGGMALQAAVAVLGWGGFAAILLAAGPETPPMATALALGLTGSLGTVALSMILARTPLARVLVPLGQASLAIYLVHTIVSAGVRIMLKQAGIAPDTVLSLGAATLVGLIVPWMVWRWASGKGLTRPLGFGGPAPGQAPSARESAA